MRQKLKLIVFAALSAALTVAGLSIAAGGSGGSGSSSGDNDPKTHHPFGPPGMRIDADVADVMRQVHEAVERKAPAIAGPIIQKAEDGGKITSAQADQLRSLVQARADHKRPSADPRTLFSDSDARAVLQAIFSAEAAQAPDIGEPIIQKAVDEKKITSAQADQIRSRLKNPPRFRHGPGFGPGPGHLHGTPAVRPGRRKTSWATSTGRSRRRPRRSRARSSRRPRTPATSRARRPTGCGQRRRRSRMESVPAPARERC